MTKFVVGGAGHGLKIIEYMRDLEGETEDPNIYLWGPIGPAIREFDWEDFTVWLEVMGLPEVVVEKQRGLQYTGKDWQEMLDTATNDAGMIEGAMKMLDMHRKHAVKCINNTKARAKKLSGGTKLLMSPLEAVQEVLRELKYMQQQGFGRYHGADVFASMLASDRAIDAMLRIIQTEDDDTCLAALQALLVLSKASEDRPTEASFSESERRFDRRKLIVKANGTRVLLQVLAPTEGEGDEEGGQLFVRSPECQEEALRILKTITVFPSHWIGWSGDDMSRVYESTCTALVNHGMPILLNAIMHSPSYEVKSLGISLIGDLMYDDDLGVKRTSGVLLTSSFYVEPKARARLFKGGGSSSASRTGSKANSQASSRPDSRGSSAMGSLETSGEPLGERRRKVAESGAFDALAELVSSQEKAPARVVLRQLAAKGLPKADRLGESDPYLRVFCEGVEQQTVVIDNTSQPEWSDTLRFDVQDVATAKLVILCFDQNDNAPDKFMCMTTVSLAEVTAGAVEASVSQSTELLSHTEILAKFAAGTKSQARQSGNVFRLDEWQEMCERSGTKPTLAGVLGSFHFTLELNTSYRHDAEMLRIQAESLATLHMLLSNREMRDTLRYHAIQARQGEGRTLSSEELDQHVIAEYQREGGGSRRASVDARGGGGGSARSSRPASGASGGGGGDVLEVRDEDAVSEVGSSASARGGALGQKLAKVVESAIRLLGSISEQARSSGAAVLTDLALEHSSRGQILACGAANALLEALEFGSEHTQLQACQCLSLLSLHPHFAQHLLSPSGHLGASSDGLRPLVDVLTGLGGDNDDVSAAVLAVLGNCCLNNKECLDAILLSKAPIEVVRRMHSYRCDARAEGSTLLALLSQDEDSRRLVSTFAGRLGDKTSTVLDALSTALCTFENPTDAKAQVGALDARAAAASALCQLARYGGLMELVRVIAEGDQEIKNEAASAMAKIADEDSEKDHIVSTGVVTSLLEMIIVSSTPRARLLAGRVLAKVSEPGQNEHMNDVIKRIKKVCEVQPALGMSCIVPTIDILLRSLDEAQRAAAAQCLTSWCMVRELAEQIWFNGAEPLIDLLLTDAKVNSDGVYYAVQAMVSLGTHEEMRESLATFTFMWEGEKRGTMIAVRKVLKYAPRDITCEAAGIFYTLWEFGGLEQLTDILMNEDAELATLKFCAQSLQPLCSKPVTRRRIADQAGYDMDGVGVWLSNFIMMDV